MTFEIEVGGRTRTVSIEPVRGADARGGEFHVFLDGVPHEVGVVQTDLGLTATLAGGRIVDAAVTAQGLGEWLIQLPHVSLVATVDGRRHTGASREGSVAGAQRVTAPMPGRVMRVLIRAGDEVTAGQGLVVVEAMKMENELVSPKAGTVKDVAVTEGQSIEAGRLLVIVE